MGIRGYIYKPSDHKNKSFDQLFVIIHHSTFFLLVNPLFFLGHYMFGGSLHLATGCWSVFVGLQAGFGLDSPGVFTTAWHDPPVSTIPLSHPSHDSSNFRCFKSHGNLSVFPFLVCFFKNWTSCMYWNRANRVSYTEKQAHGYTMWGPQTIAKLVSDSYDSYGLWYNDTYNSTFQVFFKMYKPTITNLGGQDGPYCPYFSSKLGTSPTSSRTCAKSSGSP